MRASVAERLQFMPISATFLLALLALLAGDPLAGMPGGAVLDGDTDWVIVARNNKVVDGCDMPCEDSRIETEQLKTGVLVRYEDPTHLKAGTYVYRFMTESDTVKVGTLVVSKDGKRTYSRSVR